MQVGAHAGLRPPSVQRTSTPLHVSAWHFVKRLFIWLFAVLSSLSFIFSGHYCVNNLPTKPSCSCVETLSPLLPRQFAQALLGRPLSPRASSAPRKTLLLDLDETLVHSTVKSAAGSHYQVDIFLDNGYCIFYVFKRPYVDLFLQQVSQWYDVIIFTASLRQYADPVIDRLDTRGYSKKRLFRESCVLREGNFVKELTRLGFDSARTVIIDNSPVAYSLNKSNAIPIESWFGENRHDRSLLDLLPLLDALRHTQDVRSLLGLRAGAQ